MLDPGADQLLKEEIANKFLALNGSSYKYIFNRFYVSERSNYIMVQNENQFWKK
jgi:hypothetical protein